MSVYVIMEETLNGIADAVRLKTGLSSNMTPAELEAAIRSIDIKSNDDLDGLIERSSERIESNTAKYIASYAFFMNPSVRVVVLPAAKLIGDYAFSDCVNLEHVSTGATKIGSYAFYGCDELLEVLFDPTLSEIGVAAFDGCASLQKIDLKNTSVNTIMPGAFASSGLNELWLPKNQYCSITNTGAFSGTPIGIGGSGGTIYVPMRFRVRYEANTIWASVFANENNRVVSYE